MRAFVKMSVLTMVLGLAAALSAPVQAQTGGMTHKMPRAEGRGQMGHGPGMEHAQEVMAQLNLTEAQKQQIHQLMSESQAKHKDVMQQMMKLHEQLRDQVFADDGPNEADAKATARQISDLQQDMMQSQIDLHARISKVLDPAQRKKMREMPMGGMMRMMGGN